MHLTFYDDNESWLRMLPLSYTRPIADLRVGILKIHEKWSRCLNADQVGHRTVSYLNTKFGGPASKSLTIRGGVLPDQELVVRVKALDVSELLTYQGIVIAGFFDPEEEIALGNRKEIKIGDIRMVQYPWDLFRMNGDEIRSDYDLLTSNRSSIKIMDQHTVTYGHQIFLEEGASVKNAVLNAENGPIYLGKHSDIQEGAMIRGPFALGDHAVINMGAKVRGDTTIGPFSKAGGEISNSILQGYSNKGHDGFLGNSVIGEWCNLGADTNNSNLKNNYANVKMWDYQQGRFLDTGLQFCGLVMGDHSKCGINTMFNTGTSVGVSANIFGEGFPRNIIPSFAWGGASGFSTYQTKKAFETAELVMQRRGEALTAEDKAVLSHIFEMTSDYRVWENK